MTREQQMGRDLAVWGLLGAVRVIAEDRVRLGDEYQMGALRAALKRCEARLAAIEAEAAVANDAEPVSAA